MSCFLLNLQNIVFAVVKLLYILIIIEPAISYNTKFVQNGFIFLSFFSGQAKILNRARARLLFPSVSVSPTVYREEKALAFHRQSCYNVQYFILFLIFEQERRTP
jgi:hypothetical protein